MYFFKLRYQIIFILKIFYLIFIFRLSHKDEVYIYWDGERKGWPFKWMAPETFVVSGEEQENFEFSLYSDIWYYFRE